MWTKFIFFVAAAVVVVIVCVLLFSSMRINKQMVYPASYLIVKNNKKHISGSWIELQCTLKSKRKKMLENNNNLAPSPPPHLRFYFTVYQQQRLEFPFFADEIKNCVLSFISFCLHFLRKHTANTRIESYQGEREREDEKKSAPYASHHSRLREINGWHTLLSF